MCITSVAAQKRYKRKIHVASSTSSSTTATQLLETGRPLLPRLSRQEPGQITLFVTRASDQTRSASSAISARTTSSKESGQERRSETFAFANGPSERLGMFWMSWENVEVPIRASDEVVEHNEVFVYW